MTDKGKVLVAMSGGVDSSVAAALLLRGGYDVTGVFICMGTAGADGNRGCCSPQDAADARRVAQTLGIPLHVLNMGDRFEAIVEHFVAEYARGRTPNPCIDCNARIKFGQLLHQADALGVRYVASGHYARMISHEGGAAIARGLFRPKDQAYALAGLARESLPRILLPIGETDGKEQVRAVARELGLNVHDKPDSQDVCFAGDESYAAVLAQRCPEALRPGPIVDAAGKVLGQHEGYGRYTIGQRRGLRVAAGVPMYVTAIDAATATVTIGPVEQLQATHLRAGSVNWHAQVPAVFEAIVQIRYNHAGAPGTVRLTDDGFEVEFHQPVTAVTPGQAAVVFDGQRLLGGGWIN